LKLVSNDGAHDLLEPFLICFFYYQMNGQQEEGDEFIIFKVINLPFDVN